MKRLTIMELLQEGEENAISAKELAKYYNCDTRSITQEIHNLRRSGKVILSVNTGINNGFFLPADRAEVERFAKTMHSRLKQIKLATLSAEKYLSEVNQ